jgi:hypothetical protein
MSKTRTTLLALVVSSVCMATPAFADTGCKDRKFVGSYVRSVANPDVWGDGSGVSHTNVVQLTLNSDGTAYEQQTGFPDIVLSSGTGTPSVGSWQCRADGKLVVTVILSVYVPTSDAASHGFLNVPADLLLLFHSRSTYLFSVTDDNTITRIEARSRRYAPAEDPTDPNGGTLRPLNTSTVAYKRLAASDADLLVP